MHAHCVASILKSDGSIDVAVVVVFVVTAVVIIVVVAVVAVTESVPVTATTFVKLGVVVARLLFSMLSHCCCDGLKRNISSFNSGF